LARIVSALVRYGGEYVKRTEAEYTEQVRGRLERQLKRRAKELGYEVVKAADGPGSGASDNPLSVPPDPPASE
jgi:hypothetical protein